MILIIYFEENSKKYFGYKLTDSPHKENLVSGKTIKYNNINYIVSSINQSYKPEYETLIFEVGLVESEV